MTILTFLVKNLSLIHAGTAAEKTLAALKLAAVPAVGLTLSERFAGWYIDNQVFMTFVFISIMLDMVLGSWVHYFIKHDFNLKKLVYGFFSKTAVLISGYVLFEMIHQIVQDIEIIATYFKVTLQLAVLLYPAGSALANISIISNGSFPPTRWMRIIDKFKREGNLDDIKINKNENTQNSKPTDGSAAADQLQNQEENSGN